MKKKKKKTLLKWAEKFFNDDKNLTLDPTDFIPQEELDIQFGKLDLLQEAIEDDISEWAIDKQEDVIDNGEKGIVRCLIISRGLEEYFFCFDPTGQMRGYSKKLPRHLISRVCNAMNDIVRA